VITLTSSSVKDENSILEPKKVFPSQKTIEKVSDHLRYAFPPNSVTIMRFKPL